MIAVIVIAYFGWKIRKGQDAYFIKLEMRYTRYLAVPLIPVMFLNLRRTLEPSNPTGVTNRALALDHIQFDWTVFALWLFISVGLLSIWGTYPVYKSFQGVSVVFCVYCILLVFLRSVEATAYEDGQQRPVRYHSFSNETGQDHKSVFENFELSSTPDAPPKCL